MAVGLLNLAPSVSKPEETKPDRAILPTDRLYRFSLEQTHQMLQAGILGESERVVLLDGVLVKKMTIGDSHVAVTKLLAEALRILLPQGWHVGKEDPICLPAGPTGYPSEPEPDVTILRGKIRDYLRRKPLPTDVGLLVEVADTSLREDREALGRFAWSKIAIVWIVNLHNRTLEVYSNPSGPDEDPRYSSMRTFNESDTVPVVLDGVEVGRIEVAAILP